MSCMVWLHKQNVHTVCISYCARTQVLCSHWNMHCAFVCMGRFEALLWILLWPWSVRPVLPRWPTVGCAPYHACLCIYPALRSLTRQMLERCCYRKIAVLVGGHIRAGGQLWPVHTAAMTSAQDCTSGHPDDSVAGLQFMMEVTSVLVDGPDQHPRAALTSTLGRVYTHLVTSA